MDVTHNFRFNVNEFRQAEIGHTTMIHLMITNKKIKYITNYKRKTVLDVRNREMERNREKTGF